MKIAGYQTHPAADLFPMMEEAELRQLADDITKNGQIHPIILFEGKVLDGRNRLKACELAGVKPVTRHWGDPGFSYAGMKAIAMSPVEWVLAANLKRRHLTPGQAAAVAVEALPLLTKEAKARQGATLKKGDQLPSASRGANGKPGKAAEHAAELVGVGSRTVERAKKVKEDAPQLFEKVKSGEITVKQAEKQIRKSEQVRQVRTYVPPEGKFGVIAADFPWRYDDALDGSDNARGGTDYPTMSMEEISAHGVPAADDCILWMWTTNAHMEDAYVILRCWDFDPKTVLTWDKMRMGTGKWLRGQTEHCIVAVKGNPVITLTNQTTLIREPRREHSRKPEAFYRLVDEVCPSKSRLDMFARESRPGWVAHGSDATKFDAKASRGKRHGHA